MAARDPLGAHAAAFFARHGLAGAGVAAVSGGRDSMALLDALAGIGRIAVVLHVHHGLRGADADADAALVASTSAGLGLPVRIVRAGVAPASGVEAWARGVRLAAFAEAAGAAGAAWVATAHHEDDQAETLLLALLRGAGTRGLAAMRPVRRLDARPGPFGGGEGGDGAARRVLLVRPFLDVPRAALADHAAARGLAWRHDASNDDASMRRNAVRHDILPRLDALVPGAARRIAASAASIAAERRLAAPARHRLRVAALVPDPPPGPSSATVPPGTVETTASPDGGTVRLAALAGLVPEIRRSLLLDALAAFLPGVPADARAAARLDALACGQVGRRLTHPAGTVWRGRGVLRFVPTGAGDPTADAAGGGAAQPLPIGGSVAVAGGVVRLDAAGPPEAFARDAAVAWFDAAALALPLAVRRWHAGDRMRPFGMAGRSRLVSDLLTTARVPSERRAAAPVVVDASGEIVALVGIRAAHVAVVTGETRRVLALRFVAAPVPNGSDDESGNESGAVR